MTATPLPFESRSATGFLKPMFSALQRRALRASIIFGSVFMIGLAVICWQIYELIPSATRSEVLGVNGVVAALAIAFLWIGVAFSATAAAALIFVRQHVSGPAAELARTHEAIAKGDFSSAYKPATSNVAVDRLSRSTLTMLTELRSLATKMRGSAQENDQLATQITQSVQSAAAA